MSKTTLQLTLLAIILVLAQAIVFNHVILFNVAVPMVFIYVILRLPVTMSLNVVLTVSFLLGLVIDMFSDTPGMNALSCTLIAMLRRPVLRLYIPREDDMTIPEPSMRSLGTATYVKYLFTMTLLYCFFIFTIEAFSIFNALQTMLRIVCSTILSAAIMLGIDSLMGKQREKRL